MVILGSLSAMVLSVVFLVAGAAKLRQPVPTAAGFVSMGVPGVIVRPVAVFEAVVALLLVVRPRAGAVAALATLVAFTLVLVRALRRAGSTPSATVRCNCFGGAAKLTSRALLRNAALLALAVSALVPGRLHLTLPSVLFGGVAAGVIGVGREIRSVRASVGRLLPGVPAPVPGGTP